MALDNINQIHDRVDRAVTATIPIASGVMSGVKPENYLQQMELAKTMATCRAGIPAWLRGSIGDCLMIWSRATRWGLDPFFVAEQSFLMQGKGGEVKVGYQSQLIHAIVESMAPLKGRLRYEIIGEGNDRYCVVWGLFKGEDLPHKFKSETLGKRIKDIGYSQQGNFRGSPLWLQKPEVQLFYDASRDWARINCPDVLAGVYAREELLDMEPVDTPPTQPKVDSLIQRLKDANLKDARGYDAEKIAKEMAGNMEAGTAQQEVSSNDDQGRGDELVADTGGPDNVVDLGDGDRDQGGSGGAGESDWDVVGEFAGQEGQDEDFDQSKVFPPDRITSGPSRASGIGTASSPKGKR